MLLYAIHCELFPRVRFFVTSLLRDTEGAVEFYNRRGMAGQWIKGVLPVSVHEAGGRPG